MLALGQLEAVSLLELSIALSKSI
jgi:hypothetical protein